MMETEIHWMGLQPYGDAYKIEENTTLSEEGNLLDLQVKTECVDYSYDLKSEIKVEDNPVPVSFPMVKSKFDEDSLELETVQKEQKVEVSFEEAEVSAEGTVDNVEKSGSSECDWIASDENKLIQILSCRLDSSAFGDISHDSIKCNICNEIFVTPQSLKRHFRIHTFKKSLKCDVCGKCFSRSRNLKQHAGLHTGNRQFKCDVCGKCFSRALSLKRHSRIHTGEKPFKCDVCELCFSQAEHLKNHSRIHTGERPFKCRRCGKCFSQSQSLKSHARTHITKWSFKCDLCGKCFSQLQRLKFHSRTHTEQGPFKCHLCGKYFSRSGYLRKHSLRHTKDHSNARSAECASQKRVS